MNIEPHVTSGRLVRVVADERRREILQYLQSTDRAAISLQELAAKLEPAVGGSDQAESPPRRVAIELHHNHLPRLDEAGLIDYDPHGGTVSTRTDAAVTRLLRASVPS